MDRRLPELSAERPGMHGAATARAEAHTARLALIYALLDARDHIHLEHLEAALAVWTYAHDSSAWIFGDSLGDPTADDIWTLAKTRPDGISRTEVRDLFSRNKKAREIDRALGALEDAGRLQRRRPSQTVAADPPSSGSHRSPKTAGGAPREHRRRYSQAARPPGRCLTRQTGTTLIGTAFNRRAARR